MVGPSQSDPNSAMMPIDWYTAWKQIPSLPLPPDQPKPEKVPRYIINAERLSTEELCSRRRFWTEKYQNLRISLIRALYMALDAGLTTEDDPEKAAENQLLALAREPGLDIVGGDVFAIAVHHAKLAGILSLALRSAWVEPWKPVASVRLPKDRRWDSALYDVGEGPLRRIALVDHWSDDRKTQERWGWRTVGELCAVNQMIHINAITIGASHDRKRYSPWTRCHKAPHTNVIRFKRKQGTEGFSQTFREVWREDSGIPTEAWLTKMRADGCITDLVHTLEVPVPLNRDAYLAEMHRLSREMRKSADLPPMRLAGCFGFSPCPFRGVCHGGTTPEEHGFIPREAV